jgi:transcriptional pleiotropic repressor
MLLKRMQNVSQVLQNDGTSVDFNDLAEALRVSYDDVSAYIISKKGKLLGYSLQDGVDSTPFDEEWIESLRMPNDLNSSLLKVGALSGGKEPGNMLGTDCAMIVPVVGGGRRVGTLLLVKSKGNFSDDDEVIAEYASTAIGMIISAAIDEEYEAQVEERRMARSAIRSLSYSEIMAVQHIFDELEGDEGLADSIDIQDILLLYPALVLNHFPFKQGQHGKTTAKGEGTYSEKRCKDL